MLRAMFAKEPSFDGAIGWLITVGVLTFLFVISAMVLVVVK